MNMPVKGWNESLITYVMAAASPTFPIPKEVYDNGWAQNGAMKNGNTYFNIQLPLGPDKGGPLFFSQYSFMGINPNGLTDSYANYQTQNTAHALINYNYCRTNQRVSRATVTNAGGSRPVMISLVTWLMNRTMITAQSRQRLRYRPSRIHLRNR
jgi:hypothetical protein